MIATETKVSANPVAVPARSGPASSPTLMTKMPCQPTTDMPPRNVATPNSTSEESSGSRPSIPKDPNAITVITNSSGRRRAPNTRSLTTPHSSRPTIAPACASATNSVAAVIEMRPPSCR